MEEKFLKNCNAPVMGIKYVTYTPESMKSYLDDLAIVEYEGWKREEGFMQGSNLPWISFEHPSGTWMHHWWLGEDGLLTKGEFNPKLTIKLTPIVPT